jgi:hypothetical protein
MRLPLGGRVDRLAERLPVPVRFLLDSWILAQRKHRRALAVARSQPRAWTHKRAGNARFSHRPFEVSAFRRQAMRRRCRSRARAAQNGERYNVAAKCSRLAEATTAPRHTAAAAATAPAAAAAAASATTAAPAAPSTAAAAAAASAASEGQPDARLGGCGVFPVKNVKRRQADVGDFFFTKRNFMVQCGLLRRDLRSRPTRCCGRSSR